MMWFHKHGLHYYLTNLKSLKDAISLEIEKSQSEHHSVRNVLHKLETLLNELLGHLKKIVHTIDNEQHLIQKIESIIYDSYLSKKIATREKLTEYENNLHDTITTMASIVKYAENVTNKLLSSLNNTNVMSHNGVPITQIISTTTTLITELEKLEKHSLEMGKFLSNLLYQVTELRQLLIKEEQDLSWVETNIKSWLEVTKH
ncbi:MAG: hypothetical protein QW594_00575 [Candidatus Woesearchaeota archaeon]